MHVDAEVDNAISAGECRGDVTELAARVRPGDVVTQVGEQRRAARAMPGVVAVFTGAELEAMTVPGPDVLMALMGAGGSQDAGGFPSG